MKQLTEKAGRLLLALLLVVSLVPASLAGSLQTVKAADDMSNQEMYDSVAYRALEYLGYDSAHTLRDNGWTFNPSYVGAKLRASSYWSSCRPRWQGKTLDYKEFTGSASQVIDPADRETVYKKGGFNCSQAAQYFIFGYLVDQLGYSFPGLANRTAVTINGSVGGFGSVYRLIRTLDDYINRYPEYCMRVLTKEKRNAAATLEAFNNKLQPGDIICMWAPDDTYQHVAIYVGKHNGTHYLFHSGVVGRGPELITLDALVGQQLSSSSQADQESYQAILKDSGSDWKNEPVKASGSSQNLYTAYRMLQPDGYGRLEKSIGTGSELCQLAGNDFYSLKGARYGLYSDYACTTQALDSSGKPAVLVTGSSGSAELRMPVGHYYVREIKAPLGFQLDETVYELEITSQNTDDNPALLQVSDDALFDPFTLLLTKKNGEGQVIAGAQFTLAYFNGDYASVSQARKNQPLRQWVLETDSNGRIRYDGQHLVSGDELFVDEDGNEVLIDGTYVLEETLVPAHYSKAPLLMIKVRGAQASLYDAEGTVEIGTIMEAGYDLRETATGYLKIIKESSDSEFGASHTLAGTEYGVYRDENAQHPADCPSLVIGENNQSNTIELDPGTYYLKELKAAADYQLDERIYPVTVIENETVTVTCSDDPASGKLVVIKKAADETYQLTHPLTGAQYGVYKDEQCSRLAVVLTVGEDGRSEAYELAMGTYYVRELCAPTGYRLSEEIQKVIIEAEKTLEITFVNEPLNGYLVIDKASLVPQYGQDHSLDGCEFTFYLDEQCSQIAQCPDGSPAILTISHGTSNQIELPEGTYYYRETACPEDYQIDETVHVVEIIAGQLVREERVNRPLYAPVAILKVDSTAQQPLAGARLQLWSAEGELISEWISTEEPEVFWLTVGNSYVLKEVECPEGFQLAEDVEFTVSDYEGSTQNIVMEDQPEGTVNTADPSGLGLYLVMMMVSVNGMSLYVLNRRHDEQP